MKPKIIRTAEDHAAALRHIESLWGAKAGTAEAEQLELWTMLVQAFEREHAPVGPPTPIEAIRFHMEQHGLQAADLVPYLGTRSRVSEVLAGKRALNVRMIRALHRGLGIPAESLIGEEAPPYVTEGGTARAGVVEADLAALPLEEMAARGWFDGVEGRGAKRLQAGVAQLRAVAGDPASLGELWLRDGSRGAWSEADAGEGRSAARGRKRGQRGTGTDGARRSSGARQALGVQAASLDAWRMRVCVLAEAEPLAGRGGEWRDLPAEDLSFVDAAFVRQLVGLSVFDDGPVLAGRYLALHGIALVVLKPLPGLHLDGVALRTRRGTPVIGLALRHDRLDAFWSALCHELAHLVLHAARGRRWLADDLAVAHKLPRWEAEADAWMAEALVPEALWRKAQLGEAPLPERARLLARQWRVGDSVVAARVRLTGGEARVLPSLCGANRLLQLFPDHERGRRVG